MKQFKLIFRYDFNPNYQPTPEEMEVEGQKWGQWIGGLAQNGQFVETNQLGYSGRVLKSDGSFVDNIHMSGTEVLAGDMVINAQDLDEALGLAKGSPILEIGGSVEIRDVIPM
ncbi:YciI family protein [Arcicella sp. LKC2W]|uniref:YciI family protein n=1 Tax=Arcicella sp. LKC2W TaxID=2984198 RepID=UPI002B213FC4|nr:YciI family protein [Arcicella sp. LKC2W]MEA5460961.1 YciI family protein [Arcicella sp. LKC2W]